MSFDSWTGQLAVIVSIAVLTALVLSGLTFAFC